MCHQSNLICIQFYRNQISLNIFNSIARTLLYKNYQIYNKKQSQKYSHNMTHHLQSNILFLLILSSFLLHAKAKYCTIFLAKYHVHIIDDLPPNSSKLLLHCASGDDDLGNHTLYAKNYYKFEFCETFFHKTLFHCGFTWNSKYMSVDIYKSSSR